MSISKFYKTEKDDRTILEHALGSYEANIQTMREYFARTNPGLPAKYTQLSQ